MGAFFPDFSTGLNNVLAVTADIIGYIGAIFIVIGVVYGVFLAIKNLFNHKHDNFTCIRAFTGQYFLLGLEFLVGKDILESILRPGVDEVIALGLLVVIRVILGHFLAAEISGKHKTFNKLFK